MATIYTIGFTKKSLEEFVNLLKKNKITQLVDVRLNKDSQLSGFAKSKDLKYVLGQILKIKYKVIPGFSPTKELLKAYQKDKDWGKYEKKFKELIKERKLERFKDVVLNERERVCLLCSEAEADKCHRRLLAEFFSRLGNKVDVIHL
ncbi:DUF488 domain-containing protein [Candidatus Woesearchaeota archaeon]|nr:DUF488 domain-containing protein [Candidatus Woesearchaeota archaeon]